MGRRWKVLGLGLAAAMLVGGSALGAGDFGSAVQHQLHTKSADLFGVGKPLEASSSASITQQEALADPTHLLTLAGGLKAKVVTAGSAPSILDQIALWPDDAHPEWLIECNEGGTTDPALVRINIATGEWATIVTGTSTCDPVRRTPWDTILFGEEAGGGASGGAMYEGRKPS